MTASNRPCSKPAPTARRLPQLHEVRLSAAETDRLTAYARANGLTLNTVAQGAWGLLLARLTGRDDVVFGATVSGRDLPGSESMVGLFITTVPVRATPREGERMTAYLTRLQDQQAGLIEHQHLGLAGIQKAAGTGELFDTLMVFESYPDAGGHDRFTPIAHHDATHYPLTWADRARRLGLVLTAEFHGDRARAERITDALVEILKQVADDPIVGTLDGLAPGERAWLLDHGTGAVLETGGTIPKLFAAQAAATPGELGAGRGRPVVDVRRTRRVGRLGGQRPWSRGARARRRSSRCRSRARPTTSSPSWPCCGQARRTCRSTPTCRRPASPTCSPTRPRCWSWSRWTA